MIEFWLAAFLMLAVAIALLLPPLWRPQGRASTDARSANLAVFRERLARALAADPGHPKTLRLAGLAAAQAGDNETAAAHWRRLLGVLPPASVVVAELKEALAKVEGRTADIAADARITVEVKLDPRLAQRFAKEAVVFVLARAPEGGAPLAVTRLPVSELPRTVVLDRSTSMVPGRSLAQFPQVMVEARVSASGRARPDSGDLFGRIGPVVVEDDGPLELRIDQVMP